MKQFVGIFFCVLLTIMLIINICNSPRLNQMDEDVQYEYIEEDSIDVDSSYVENRVKKPLDKKAAILLIKQFEGYRSETYKCSNGVPTIGWGTTKCCLDEIYRRGYIKDTMYYVWGDTISKEQACHILSKTIDMIYSSALKCVPDVKYLNPKSQAAFISWAYQCGIGNIDSHTGIIGSFPEIAKHLDDKILYDILTERAFYGKYKTRRLKEAAVIIGAKCK